MTFRFPRKFIISSVLLTILSFTPDRGYSQSPSAKGSQVFQELLDYSLKEKKGLTFFVQGQAIAGVVIKIISEDAVEVRNQTSSRIIIRLDRVDAVAAN